MTRPAPLVVLAAAAMGGCHSQFRVELWNDTGHAMDVGIVEQRSADTRAGRHATVAPGGWFEYSLDKSDPWPRRAAHLHIRDIDAATDLDLTGQQLFRGRVLLTGTAIAVEPITRQESEERRRKN